MKKDKIRWGIIGLGKIAAKWVEDLLLCREAELYAVASRSRTKADAFAEKYGAEKAYGSYDQLINDPEVDVVYVATPHTFHYENTIASLSNGKSVLCEKPMGMNLLEVDKMIALAKKNNLFLMEAMWTRFIPSIEKMLDIVKQGSLGKILFIRADFGFKASWDPSGRVFNKALGGGSLLDIGIYPVFLSRLLLGDPKEIKAVARKSITGVDTYCAVLFDYEGGEKAVLESTFEADTPIEAYIYGSKGFLKLHKRFHHTKKISVHLTDHDKEEEIILNYVGNGYYHEIKEVVDRLKNNEIQSSKFTWEESRNLIALLDKIREKINLHY